MYPLHGDAGLFNRDGTLAIRSLLLIHLPYPSPTVQHVAAVARWLNTEWDPEGNHSGLLIIHFDTVQTCTLKNNTVFPIISHGGNLIDTNRISRRAWQQR